MSNPDPDDYQDWDEQERAYCDTCHNTGEVDCYCGGDLCVCGAYVHPCPDCRD